MKRDRRVLAAARRTPISRSHEANNNTEQGRATGDELTPFAADLAHPGATAQLTGQVVEAFGKPDIVVGSQAGPD
jgi:NAD(P)-dependent dehydrogenase (short-subunit alcohol dehydrogenase family)